MTELLIDLLNSLWSVKLKRTFLGVQSPEENKGSVD